MKICFDGIAISHFKNTGMYTYTYELINELLNLYPQPKYKIVTNTGHKNNPFESRNIEFVEIQLNRKENDYSPLENYIVNNKIDIYFSLNNGFSIPNEKHCKHIMTVHNLLSCSQPNYVDKKYFKKFNTVVPNALDKSDRVIVVSEFIKNEILTYYDIPEKKIIVNYPILPKIFKKINPIRSKSFIKNKYKIYGEFILFVGSIHIRKRLDILLRAFKEILKYDDSLNLVIVGSTKGKREQYAQKLKQYAKQLSIHHRIIFTGLVDHKDLPYFYNSALCSVNLSDYEGFPTSSIEALACNTPIICSKTSSFIEILGSSAAYVNNNNVNELVSAILRISNSPNYIISKEKISQQISKYSAENSIKNIVKVFESIM